MLFDWEWNEAEFTGADHNPFHAALITIAAFEPNTKPHAIGTGFIIAANGHTAVALTAAHNFDLKQVLNPGRRAFGDLIPEGDELIFNRSNLRALHQVGGQVEMAVITSAVWDRRTDVAVLTLAAQDEESPEFFQKNLLLDERKPEIGDVIGVFGYANMSASVSIGEAGHEILQFRRRLAFRAGRVTELFPEGHILCRGPCFETTIPIFGGWSGGPAFLIPREGLLPDASPMPLAIVSHDPVAPDEVKMDRSIRGHSIMALIPHEMKKLSEGSREVLLKLDNVGVGRLNDSAN